MNTNTTAHADASKLNVKPEINEKDLKDKTEMKKPEASSFASFDQKIVDAKKEEIATPLAAKK